jgi:hypothetical protein
LDSTGVEEAFRQILTGALAVGDWSNINIPNLTVQTYFSYQQKYTGWWAARLLPMRVQGHRCPQDKH